MRSKQKHNYSIVICSAIPLTHCIIHHFVFQGVSGATSSYPRCALCQVTRLSKNPTQLSCPSIWASWGTPIKSTWPSPGPRRACASSVSLLSSLPKPHFTPFLMSLSSHRKRKAALLQQNLEKPSAALQVPSGADRRSECFSLRRQITSTCSFSSTLGAGEEMREDEWLDLLPRQHRS